MSPFRISFQATAFQDAGVGPAETLKMTEGSHEWLQYSRLEGEMEGVS